MADPTRFPRRHRLRHTLRAMLRALMVLAAGAALPAGEAPAAPVHGISMYGEPALPPDFVALPYVNPEAPKGGRLVLAEQGGFDSLNPYILKGRAPWAIRTLVVESLMARSWDEPFTLYGLLAESVDVAPDRSWVEFTLRPEARFSDGAPVTVEDVVWSMRTLGEHGHPRYRTAWAKVAAVEVTGPRSVRFRFRERDRELPLILGLRPILKKADWEGRDFERSSFAPFHGSGPYVIADFEPGRFITLRRNPDWWGRDLPVNRGKFNFDEIRYDFYADATVIFEAFKAGEVDVFRESELQRWRQGYDFGAVRRGEVVRSEIPHRRPTGMRGFVFNTRRSPLDDWRVREALITAFNYDFIVRTIAGEPLPRITSYFANSELAMRPGPAQGRVRALLEPFRELLPPGALEGYALPESRGGRDRAALRRARRLLAEAGWRIDGGRLVGPDGRAMRLELLLRQGQTEEEAIAGLWADSLARLGIALEVAVVDSAQYRERLKDYDFDLASYVRYLSLSPGNEQWLYWGSEGRERPGTRNYMGVASPAVDAMIRTMLAAESREEFVAAVRALDRILTAGRYVVPFWYSPVSRLAHKAWARFPERLPLYGDWIGFLPDVWWDARAGGG